MAFRKLTPETPSTKVGGENLLRVHADQGFCCADSAVAIKSFSNTAHDLTVEGIASIEIDGTTYTFAATASTQADLKAAILKAFRDAFYSEVGGQAITITGAAAATVVTVKTTANLTQMTGASATAVAFTAA